MKVRPISRGSRYTGTDSIAVTKRGATCHFGDCNDDCYAGLPVCFMCALMIMRFMRELLDGMAARPPLDTDLLGEDEDVPVDVQPPQSPQHFVYYLMLDPTTVKIGTTRNLARRIGQHGSSLQYVVALELGGHELERARHDQFPMERHGIKEVFTISDALRQHIESITPQRDELMKLALGE